jgi:hypothetical protein
VPDKAPIPRRIGVFQMSVYDRGQGKYFRKGTYFHYRGPHPLHEDPTMVHLACAGPSDDYFRQDGWSKAITFPGIKPK